MLRRPSLPSPPPTAHGRRGEESAGAARRLLRVALLHALATVTAVSRTPDRVLRRLMPGMAAAGTVIPLWAPSWAVSEFPLHVALVQAVTAVTAVRRGALVHPSGRVGAAVLLGASVVVTSAWRNCRRTDTTFEEVLTSTLGAGCQPELPPMPSRESRAQWRQLWLPRLSERKCYLRHENLSYGDNGIRNHLDVWHRDDLAPGAGAPVLIQIHGSAWMKGSKRGQGYPLLAHMAARGWVCVAINYSLAPTARWPAHIHDVKRAIAWVKRSIAAYGGDPGCVALTGGSAGGHLTALAALTPNEPTFQPGFEGEDTSVVAAVPVYGVYDLLDRAGDSPPEQEVFLRRIVIGASKEEAYQTWHDGSPLSWINSAAPPFLVIHGGNDTWTNPEQARAFSAALARVSRNPVAYAELPGAQHMFDLLPTVRAAATVAAIDRFLTWVVHRRTAAHSSAAAGYATAIE